MAGRHPCYQEPMTASAIRIIGIDPGLRRTGWGILEIGWGAALLCGERPDHVGR
jgi:hypothetical protein